MVRSLQRKVLLLLGASAFMACGDSGITDGPNGGSNGTGNGGEGPSNGGGGATTSGEGGSTTSFTEGGAGGGNGGAASCFSESAEGERKELDILVVLNRSGSMQGALWDGSLNALEQFFENPASQGIRAGMNFFPPQSGDDSCDPGSYEPPVLPLADLPNDAPTLVSAMNATTPAGNATPIYGAMYGSLQWATLHQDDNPDRVVVVVLASDGDPTDCNTSISAIADISETAYAYNGVRTYVVAIAGATLASLDEIAIAGGTEAALDITNDISLFQEKMEEIRGEVLGCEFDIPQPMDDEFDPLKLNVEYSPDGVAEAITIPQVPSEGDCGTDPGWYYDNPAAPTKIILCPGSCGDVQTNPLAVITFAFGCPTVIAM